MHFILIIKGDNHVYISRSDEQNMASETKSNTLCNITDSNIDTNVTKRKVTQEESFNYEKENGVLTKHSKRIQQMKRIKSLLITDKGNV